MVGLGRTWPQDLRFFFCDGEQSARDCCARLEWTVMMSEVSDISDLVTSWGQMNEAGGGVHCECTSEKGVERKCWAG